MKSFIEILNAYGYITTIIVFLAVVIKIINWIRGITPALWRLGTGLACRKIAILSDGENYFTIKSLLLDSRLFRENNIIHIPNDSIKKAEKYNVILAHWKSLSENLESVLNFKKDSTVLIIYAPQEEGFIDKEKIKEINKHRNITIANFRGRLLNDVVTSLITTG